MAEVPEIPTELSYDGRMINSKIVASTKSYIKPESNDLNGSSVTFNIPNNVGESYLNLKETRILLQCAIQKIATPYTKYAKAEGSKVIPSNNFLAALFDNVEVHLNNAVVSTQDMSYHMKAYVNMAHSWTKSTQEAEFNNTGFLFEDGMGDFTATEGVKGVYDSGTKAITTVPVEETTAWKLQELFYEDDGDGKVHTFYAKIHEMPFTTEQFLPGNMKVTVQFFRSPKDTYLKGTDTSAYHVVISRFELVTVYSQLSRDIYNALETKLMSDKLEIPVIRTMIVKHRLNASQTPQTEPNVLQGLTPVIPERIYFTFVPLNYNSAGKGDYNYDFKHENLKSFTFNLPNGNYVPSVSMPEFDLGGGLANNIPYTDFLECFGLRDGLDTLVSQELYDDGHSFFCVKIVPNPVQDEVIQPTATGHLGLGLCFKAGSPSADRQMLVWAEFKEHITIHKNRGVTTTWTS